MTSTLVGIEITSNTGALVSCTTCFTYLEEGVILAIVPSSGQVGTRVGITGLRLWGGGSRVVSVSLANIYASIVLESDNLVVVVAGPYLSTGVGDVKLTADSGATITNVGGWTYLPSGNILDVHPSSGQSGTLVTIIGSNFLQGGSTIISVTLAGMTSAIMFQNSTYLIVEAGPSSAAVGDVVITADSGATVTRLNGWTYVDPGFIQLVQPSSGQLGTVVVITGYHLLAGGSKITNVFLCGVDALICTRVPP